MTSKTKRKISSLNLEVKEKLLNINKNDLDEKFNCKGNRRILCSEYKCKKCFYKSFASKHLAKFWSKKNNITPREISGRTHKEFIFDCPVCKHEFPKDLSNAAVILSPKTGCPFCAGKKLCDNNDNNNCKTCFNKSFASQPEAKYWSDKNDLKPSEVTKSSDKEIWFDCNECKHTFKMPLHRISGSQKSWCQYCSIPTKLLCENENCNHCRSRSFASHPKSIEWSPSNKLKPRNVFLHSNDKFKFICSKCNHTYKCQLSHLSGKNEIEQGCPFCANQKLCKNENCKICESKSLLSHPMGKLFSEENQCLARSVFRHSNIEYKFKCNICKHTFEASPNHFKNDYYCPFCSHKKLCDDEKCNFCFKNSLASSPFAYLWSSKNKSKPRNVFKQCNDKYYFKCDKCLHEFKTSPDKQHSHETSGCGYCGKRKLCKLKKNCKWCFDHSFASHPYANRWSKKNPYKPGEIHLNCVSDFLFDCPECNSEYSASPNHVTSRNQGCPHCRYKTESMFREFLKIHFGDEFKHRATFDWCKGKRHYPFDFSIESINMKCICEIDGPQHFKQVGNMSDPEKTRKRDVYKMKMAIENGYSILRISQEDIYYNRIDWKSTSLEMIKCIQNVNRPQIFYLSFNNSLYTQHKLLMSE